MNLSRCVFIVVPFALSMGLAACDDPAANAPKASVSSTAATTKATTAPTSTAATTAKPTAAGALAVDTASSTIGFVGSKVTGKHEGKFEKFSGSVTLAGGKPEGGKVEIEIDPASVKTDSEKLDGHLKAPDFFDVAKFPKATFVSTDVKAGGDKGATHTVTGDLDLHGVKKSISFPATIQATANDVTANAEFTINRKDFGIAYAGMKDDLIKDDVVIKLSLKAKSK